MTMQNTTRPCAHCGDTFEPYGRSHGTSATYCRPCGYSYRRAHKTGKVAEWHAERSALCACGAPLPAGRTRYCAECADWSKYQQVDRRTFTCALESCHNLCSTGRGHARFCSDSCNQTAKRARKRGGRHSVNVHPHWVTSQPVHGPFMESWPVFGPAKPPPRSDRPCMDCGDVMFDVASNRKRCDECSRIRNIDRTMRLYETAAQAGLVKQAMHWRYALVNHLRERDGDDCALCAKPMRFDVTTGPRGDSDHGATVDHIWPRSLGGGNELENLQLAHWSCNRAKGNRVKAQQLRLVG